MGRPQLSSHCSSYEVAPSSAQGVAWLSLHQTLFREVPGGWPWPNQSPTQAALQLTYPLSGFRHSGAPAKKKITLVNIYATNTEYDDTKES